MHSERINKRHIHVWDRRGTLKNTLHKNNKMTPTHVSPNRRRDTGFYYKLITHAINTSHSSQNMTAIWDTADHGVLSKMYTTSDKAHVNEWEHCGGKGWTILEKCRIMFRSAVYLLKLRLPCTCPGALTFEKYWNLTCTIREQSFPWEFITFTLTQVIVWVSNFSLCYRNIWPLVYLLLIK